MRIGTVFPHFDRRRYDVHVKVSNAGIWHSVEPEKEILGRQRL